MVRAGKYLRALLRDMRTRNTGYGCRKKKLHLYNRFATDDDDDGDNDAE